MPRVKTGLTTSELAVLGLLARGPDYGYRLQQHFSGRSALARVCPIEPAALYAVLKSLSGLELIDGEWDRSQYPPKAVYSITLEGEAAFERWLMSPVSRIREIRADFLVKLYFALQRDPALAEVLLEAQAEVCRQYEAEYASELAAADEDSFEAMFITSKLSAATITRDWLQQWASRLREDANAPPAAPSGPAVAGHRTGRQPADRRG
jgi:PadR family transcriptional regulator AphA